MSQIRFSPKLLIIIMVALFFGIALLFRIYLPYDQVLSGNWIKFGDTDAYYHMRLVDNLLHHFPYFITFDPYTYYPHGTEVSWPPLFDLLIAGIAWMIGLGSPSQQVVDVVGAYFPAFLGALVVIPVYFLGRELLGKWAGLLSAGLIATLPGEFLYRSLLGYTDHHVIETLFSTLALLFLILAIKAARQNHLTLGHFKRRDWVTITKPLLYSLLTGILLGMYLLSWVGGLFMIFIIAIYLVTQFIIHHFRGEDTGYLAIVGTLSLLVAFGLSWPLIPESWFGRIYPQSMLIAALLPVVLNIISRLMISKKIKRVYYPLALVGLGLAGLSVYYVIAPSILSLIASLFSIFIPKGAALTIAEVQPLLLSNGKLSLAIAWNYFTISFFLSFISLGMLTYASVKKGSAEKNLLIVWSIMVLAATFGQRRFAYYLAVNVALLTGYLSWQILQFTNLRRLATEHAGESQESKAKVKEKVSSYTTAHPVIIALGVIVVFFLVFYPNIEIAVATAKQDTFTNSNAWYDSLTWLRENSPAPFDTPDFYYELYEPPVAGEDYEYPESAYGIMAWWDYGHYITRISHRIPICNPFQQGASQAAQFFTAQEEASANKIMDDLGAKYVVIDDLTATAKFGAIAAWADTNSSNFFDLYYTRQENRLRPIRIYYPKYYHSLSTRLYNFDGKKVMPESTTVISYREMVSTNGKPYKEIINLMSFPNYKAATKYVSSQRPDEYIIIGTNPFVSPVPLEPLKDYKLIYSSDRLVEQPGIGMISPVKIFEYTP